MEHEGLYKNNRPKITGLTNFDLKMVALITMVIGHSAMIFDGSNGPNLWFLIVAGPVAFPLFAFLMAEGCRYTRSMEKYMLRLLVFAVLIQSCFYVIKYCMETYLNAGGMFSGLPDFNIFFTLLLGVFSIFCYEKIRQSGLPLYIREISAYIPVLAAMAVSECLGADYGWKGLFLIFGFYVFKNRIAQIFITFIFIVLQYWSHLDVVYYDMLISGTSAWFLMPFSALISMIFIALYNGKLGRNWKWFFYLAYPGQYVLLGLIYMLFYLF